MRCHSLQPYDRSRSSRVSCPQAQRRCRRPCMRSRTRCRLSCAAHASRSVWYRTQQPRLGAEHFAGAGCVQFDERTAPFCDPGLIETAVRTFATAPGVSFGEALQQVDGKICGEDLASGLECARAGSGAPRDCSPELYWVAYVTGDPNGPAHLHRDLSLDSCGLPRMKHS